MFFQHRSIDSVVRQKMETKQILWGIIHQNRKKLQEKINFSELYTKALKRRTYACCSFVAQTSQFVAGDRCVFRKFSSNRTGCSQDCVGPETVKSEGPLPEVLTATTETTQQLMSPIDIERSA